MNKNTIRRICDSVEPDWVDVKVVPKEEDRGRVKDIMEELGYTVEEEGVIDEDQGELLQCPQMNSLSL